MEVTRVSPESAREEGAALAPTHLHHATTLQPRRASFSHLSHHPLHPKRSATSINEQRLCDKSDSEDGKHDDAGDLEPGKGRFLATRSKTGIQLNSVDRYEWAENLWVAPAFQTSYKELRLSYDEFHVAATSRQWHDLLDLHKRFTDRGDLLKLARHTTTGGSASQATASDELSKLSKISHVALEYSKLLEVVANQSPEYVCLAWATIRLLLIAHTNHTKLKVMVEDRLVSFGEELVFVNQIMLLLPSSKMISAVIEAYNVFNVFLAKAVKYYKESKVKQVLKALGFPWQTGFEFHSNQIDKAVQKIKEIAKVSQTKVAVDAYRRLNQVSAEINTSSQQLRGTLKADIRDLLQQSFTTFDRDWIERFEKIIQAAVRSRAGTPKPALSSSLSPEAARGIIQDSSQPQLAPASPALPPVTKSPQPGSYLFDFALEPKKLKRFRDRSFPDLKWLDHYEDSLNARLRHLSNPDLEQMAGLFRHNAIRSWLEKTTSKFLWLNTFRRPGPADWSTAFVVKLIDRAHESKEILVLHHFCGNSGSSQTLAAPCIMLQRLIMLLIQQNKNKLSVRKAEALSLDTCRKARDDIHELWEILQWLWQEVDTKCLYIVLDHFDSLQKGRDYDVVLESLLELVQSQGIVVKVLITSRVGGTPALVKDAMAAVLDEAQDYEIQALTIPRATAASSSSYAKVQRRQFRLASETATAENFVPYSEEKIDQMLHSSSGEDELCSWKKKPTNKPVSGSTITESDEPSDEPLLLSSDEDPIYSDPDLEFKSHDPLADCEDSDSEYEIKPKPKKKQYDWENDTDDQLGHSLQSDAMDSAPDPIIRSPKPRSTIAFQTPIWNTEEQRRDQESVSDSEFSSSDKASKKGQRPSTSTSKTSAPDLQRSRSYQIKGSFESSDSDTPSYRKKLDKTYSPPTTRPAHKHSNSAPSVTTRRKSSTSGGAAKQSATRGHTRRHPSIVLQDESSDGARGSRGGILWEPDVDADADNED